MPNFKITVTNTQKAEFVVHAKNASEAKRIFQEYMDENAKHMDVLDQSPDFKVKVESPKPISRKPKKTFLAWEDENDQSRHVEVIDKH